MFLKKLQLFFLLLTIFSFFILLYFWYSNYQFKNNPLDDKILIQIKDKHIKLQNLSYKKFGVKRKMPIKISDKMPSNLFGATTLDKKGNITIFLNKKRFQESVRYMIDDVLPHEYAHALIFALGKHLDEKSGHSLQWQNICKSLNGLKCNRFVDYNDVIISKTNPF